jgi:hypothetical protein
VWVLAGGVLAIGVGVVFFLIGLDKADKVASSAGLFVGVAGLGVAIYGVVLARRSTPQSPTPPTPQLAPQPPASQPGSTSSPGSRSVDIRGDNSGPIVMGDKNDLRP